MRVRKKPLSECQLVIEDALGGPPLTFLQLLLKRQIARSCRSERGSAGEHGREIDHDRNKENGCVARTRSIILELIPNREPSSSVNDVCGAG